jgi:hypothetical protein
MDERVNRNAIARPQKVDQRMLESTVVLVIHGSGALIMAKDWRLTYRPTDRFAPVPRGLS